MVPFSTELRAFEGASLGGGVVVGEGGAHRKVKLLKAAVPMSSVDISRTARAKAGLRLVTFGQVQRPYPCSFRRISGELRICPHCVLRPMFPSPKSSAP